MITRKLLFPTIIAMAALTACSEQDSAAEIPQPIAMTEEAVGHYCNMNILEHAGPKAQIHLENVMHPIWFSQVRDAVAFTRLPEETQEAVVIYVHDMSKAEDWAHPGDDAWLDINEAFFVIGSRKTGGMGAPETIPFGTKEAADGFAENEGGLVVRLADIPDEYVLGPVELQHDMSTPKTGSIQ